MSFWKSVLGFFGGDSGAGVADAAIDWGSDIGMGAYTDGITAGAGTLNDYWDWGSAAASGGDFLNELATQYAYDGPSMGLYAPGSTDNFALPYSAGAPNFAGMYAEDPANYVAPEVTAQAGAPVSGSYADTGRLPTRPGQATSGAVPAATGVSNATGSAWDRFAAKGKTALQDPMTYARLGLALAGGAGQAPVSPRNTRAGFDAYMAEDAAARAENAGLRAQQNATTRNLQESAGPEAYRAGVTRAANQTEALRKQLGYTNAPGFVKEALVAKQNAQGQLGAQTAFTSAQAAANRGANYLMAPGGNAGLVTAGMNLDQANLNAQAARQRQYAPIGSALESVFGTAEEDARRRAAQEGTTT